MISSFLGHDWACYYNNHSLWFHVAEEASTNDPKSKRITVCIVKMIISDLRPANVVEGSGFVDLMTTTAPEYPLAKAEYYSQQVHDVYATKSALMKSQLDSIQHTTIINGAVAIQPPQLQKGHFMVPLYRLCNIQRLTI